MKHLEKQPQQFHFSRKPKCWQKKKICMSELKIMNGLPTASIIAIFRIFIASKNRDIRDLSQLK